MAPLRKAIDASGGVTSLATALGISAQRLNNWLDRQVPAARCPDIERVTHGKVTCEELRPDVDWSVLRGGQIAA